MCAACNCIATGARIGAAILAAPAFRHKCRSGPALPVWKACRPAPWLARRPVWKPCGPAPWLARGHAGGNGRPGAAESVRSRADTVVTLRRSVVLAPASRGIVEPMDGEGYRGRGNRGDGHGDQARRGERHQGQPRSGDGYRDRPRSEPRRAGGYPAGGYPDGERGRYGQPGAAGRRDDIPGGDRRDARGPAGPGGGGQGGHRSPPDQGGGGGPRGEGQRGEGRRSRRAFLGLAAAGAAGAAVAAAELWHPGAKPAASSTVAGRPTPAPRRTTVVAENSLPGDRHWEARNLGSPHEIEGYAGKISVRRGESFPLFVSSASAGFRVTAYRLGWYHGDGARRVWRSKALRGGMQKGPVLTASTNTIETDWDPVIDVPTDDWPPGSYLLRLDADSGAQRYVPVTVRSDSTRGRVVLKNCVATWQAYNTWGGYDLYKGPDGAYATRSYVVSLDRPYDSDGAAMFLTYERNLVKLAEYLGLPLAYATSMDIAADPHLLDGASALISPGHDEYWSPAERSNVTAARDAGVNLAFLGANAMFRRTRLEPSAVGPGRAVVCYKSSYADDPAYR